MVEDKLVGTVPSGDWVHQVAKILATELRSLYVIPLSDLLLLVGPQRD